MRILRTPIGAAKPYVLDEALGFLRVEHPEARDEVDRITAASALEIEHHAGLALLLQSVRVDLDAWPQPFGTLPLPIAPFFAGGSITFTADGAAFAGFEVLHGIRPALRLTGDAPSGAISITYQAGFGAEATSIPQDLRLAVLQQAAAHYDARGASDDKLHGMTPQAARIAARYRRVGL